MFDTINRTIDRARVIITSLVTWLAAASAAVTVVVAELGDEWPVVAEYGAIALAVIAGATAVLRRVTPVPADQRGVLPPS